MRRRRPRGTTIVVLAVLAMHLLPVPVTADDHPFVYDEGQFRESPRSSTQRFIDKWILNGAALGSAIGSVVGVFVFQTLFPGPIGLVAGTVIGGTIGSLIGSYIDDRHGDAINYTSFDRPPVTKGGMWLKGVGPWEQFMYQVDSWVLNGGSLASTATHIGLSTLARCVPGVGAWLSPVMIGVADYAAAVVADNVDGTIDLASTGRKWDEAAARNEPTAADRRTTAGRAEYLDVVDAMRSGDRDAQLRAYQSYQGR